MATDKLLSSAEAAERLGITESLVRQYCRQGRIGTLVGKVWVISEDEVRLFSQIKRQVGRPKAAQNNGSRDPRKKSA